MSASCYLTDNYIPRGQLGSCSVTRLFLSMRRVWLVRLAAALSITNDVILLEVWSTFDPCYLAHFNIYECILFYCYPIKRMHSKQVLIYRLTYKIKQIPNGDWLCVLLMTCFWVNTHQICQEQIQWQLIFIQTANYNTGIMSVKTHLCL